MVDSPQDKPKPANAPELKAEAVLPELDKPGKASEHLVAIYSELRNDPQAFRTEMQKLQDLSAKDGKADNDLKIVYDDAGAVSKVEIEKDFRRNTNIFDRKSADGYLDVVDRQKIAPEQARSLVEPLLSHEEGKNSLFQAIDAVQGKADGSISREKLEAFLLKEPKDGDDNNLYSEANRGTVKQILSQWDSDQFKHLRGLENANYGTIWQPDYQQSEKLGMGRLEQVFGQNSEQLQKSFTKDNAVDAQIEADYAEEKTPAQKVADFYNENHTPQEVAQFEAQMLDSARNGARYLAEHPQLMAQLTKEVPLVQGSNNTLTYFDMDKINNYKSDLPAEMVLLAGLKASDVYLAQYGKQHSYDRLAPTGLASRPVNELVKMVFYYSDPSIQSMDDLRKPAGQSQVNYYRRW